MLQVDEVSEKNEDSYQFEMQPVASEIINQATTTILNIDDEEKAPEPMT